MSHLGPFTGEVGYELLYWLPYLKWRFGKDLAKFCAITRGGSGIWYPCRTFDAMKFLGAEKFRELLAIRHRFIGQKAWSPRDPLDARILAEMGDSDTLCHPGDMMAQLHTSSEWPHERLSAIERYPGLPERYVAVRLYTRPTFDSAATLRVKSLIESYRADLPVVLIEANGKIDDHDQLSGIEADYRVVTQAEDALETASRVISGAEQLICTYGGLSYLGPLYGVPTIALCNKAFRWKHWRQEERMTEAVGVDYTLLHLQ